MGQLAGPCGPLAGLTEAAVAIAGGQLDTRVEAGDDADLEELASAFNRMTANLQDRIEREARFTSDVSHELRSPLTTLTATVSVLEGHRDELAPRAQRALDLLDGDLQRFTRMVDDLLEISRFDAGSAELSLDEVDPGELVRRAVAAAAPVGDDGVRGPVDLPGRGRPRGRRAPPAGRQAPLRAGDGQPGRERRPLRRRGHPGPGRAPARRRRRRAAPADGHPGGGGGPRARGARAERAHLFERFYRGGRAGQRAAGEGTGLGLSLVAEHVRLHGGRVWSEDAPGGGTRFVVELPLHPARGRARRAARREEVPVSAGRSRAARRRRWSAARPWLWPACGIPTAAAPTPIARSDVPTTCSIRPTTTTTAPGHAAGVGVPEQIYLVAPDGHLVAADPGGGRPGLADPGRSAPCWPGRRRPSRRPGIQSFLEPAPACRSPSTPPAAWPPSTSPPTRSRSSGPDQTLAIAQVVYTAHPAAGRHRRDLRDRRQGHRGADRRRRPGARPGDPRRLRCPRRPLP